MAEKIKDAEDRMLESLFADGALADDGFSQAVVRRIRRQMWIRRLALPIAILVGGAIALEPLMQLVNLGSQLTETAAGLAPVSSIGLPDSVQSQLPQIIGTAGFIVAGLFAFRLSDV